MKKYPVFGCRTKRLKNGAIHPEQLIAEAVEKIEALKRSQPEDFFELVKLCRFPRHEISRACRERLHQADLFYKDEVRDIISDVILSSIVGRSLKDLEVTSPLRDDYTAKLL